MKAFKFGRPKTPGFGIDRGFYLSVLSSRAALPTLLQIINPGGDGGGVEGFGAPLAEGADKQALHRPLERGTYALASKDRKTVLRMVVISKEEAGFDPAPLLDSPLASALDQELLDRVRATWTLLQFSFESHDPMVYPALDFLLSIAQRAAFLSDGVVADPMAQRYLLPQEVFQPIRLSEEIDARDLISVHFVSRPDGVMAFTMGLKKVSLPEFELPGLPPGMEEPAARFLVAATQAVLVSGPVKAGAKLGAAALPFEVREGSTRESSYELLPPVRASAEEAISAWIEETA